MFDLPIITAFLPERSGFNFFNNILQPSGVHGTREFKPDHNFPTFSA
jgi:hypothetical protein